jgi:hypothetical protein
MSPFIELYRYDASSFLETIFGDNRDPRAKYRIEESQDILKILKENLQEAQNQQKVYAN